jgi:hypothetical protein
MNIAIAPVAFTAPSITATQPEDPIFAAIEAHRAAVARDNETLMAMSELEERLPSNISMHEQPRVQIDSYDEYDFAFEETGPAAGVKVQTMTKTKTGARLPIYVSNIEELEKQARHKPESAQAEYIARGKRLLRNATRRLRRAQKRAGLLDLKRAHDEAHVEQKERLNVLAIIEPGTLAGAAALAEYAAELLEADLAIGFSGDEELVSLLRNATSRIRKQALHA